MAINMPSDDLIEDVRPDITFARREASLGDGYKRLGPNGLNNVRERYRITWVNMTIADANTLVNTLSGSNGVESIIWTPPEEGAARTWSVESISHPNTSPMHKQVTAVFEEFFGA